MEHPDFIDGADDGYEDGLNGGWHIPEGKSDEYVEGYRIGFERGREGWA